jgi:hypothetical protein
MANITNRSPWQVKLKGQAEQKFRLKSKALAYLASQGHADPHNLPKNALRASRARRLRVFAGEAHPPFEGDARLVPWAPPPRTLRVKEAAPELPEGFAPLNADAFARRFRAHKGFAPPGSGAGDGSIPAAAAASSAGK